jgi:hypothetical protein
LTIGKESLYKSIIETPKMPFIDAYYYNSENRLVDKKKWIGFSCISMIEIRSESYLSSIIESNVELLI